MSCQIVNVSNTIEMIPNGSPKFLTKSTRNAWEKSAYYTSWLADKDVVDTIKETIMFSQHTQPLQLNNKESRNPSGSHGVGLTPVEKKIHKKKNPNNAIDTYVKKEGSTIKWWNAIADLPEYSDKFKWNPIGTIDEEEVAKENDWDVRQKDVHKKIAIERERMRNTLPMPKTILGAFGGNVVLVRLRSVVESDLCVSADDVSTPFCCSWLT
jgi:hypothetical protein